MLQRLAPGSVEYYRIAPQPRQASRWTISYSLSQAGRFRTLIRCSTLWDSTSPATSSRSASSAPARTCGSRRRSTGGRADQVGQSDGRPGKGGRRGEGGQEVRIEVGERAAYSYA